MNYRRLVMALTLVLMLGLLAACGGGAAQPTEAPAPTEAPVEPTEAPTEPPEEEAMPEVQPAKVGVMVPLTGALSEFGGNFQKSAELAQKQLAAAGYEIELRVGDTETSAIPAVETARQLVEVEGVHAVAGAASSGVTIPIAENVTIPNGVPQLSNASTSPLITNLPADEGQDFLFRTTPSDALQGVVLADLAQAGGYESVSVLYVNNPYGQGLNDVFVENFEAAGGKVPASVPHDEQPAPTYTAELRQAAEGEPGALIALSYPGHATVYLREALEGDFFGDFLFVDGTQSEEIIEAIGAEPLEGMCGTAPGSPETPSLEVFNQTYNEEYGERPPLPFMTNMYDAVAVAALAAYEAQVQGEELTPAAVRDHLRSVAGPPGETVTAGVDGFTKALQLIDEGQDINYEGAAGSIDLDENGDVVTPIQIWCYEEGQIVNKQLVAPGEEITFGEEEAAPAEIAKVAPAKIGSMVALTGALSEFGKSYQRVSELAQKHLVAAGYEIDLRIGDTETSAIPAVETARQIVEVEGAHAVAGAASSGVTIPIAENVTIPNQVPQISNASTSPLITNLPSDEGKDFLFRTIASDALQGVVLADLAQAMGYESVSVLYVNNPYGQGLNDVFVENFEAAGGKVPASVPHDEQPAPTYTAELRRAAEGEPEALIALGYPGHATVYLREALEGDFFSNFLFVDGTRSQEIIEAVGAEPLEGMCGTAPGSPQTESLEIFNQSYEAEFGELPPLPFMTNMYDAVVVAALASFEAQVQGEELTSVAVRDHLRSVANPPGETVSAVGVEGIKQALQLLSAGTEINYEGAGGSVDFDENGDVVTPIEVWCYEGGDIASKQLVTPGEEITEVP